MASTSPGEILTKALFRLKKELEPGPVLDYLLSEGVFTQTEFERCSELDGRQKVCGELLNILHNKGEDGYKHFCMVLGETQNHLKNYVDDIARDAGQPTYVFVQEAVMLKTVAEKDKIMSLKDEEIIKKTEEMQCQKKSFEEETEKLKSHYKNHIEELESGHKDEVSQMNEEHAALVERLEKDKEKLQTELEQEQDRKLAVDKKLEEERQLVSSLKEDKSQMKHNMTTLEEKYEAYTSLDTRRETEDMQSYNEMNVVASFEAGRCVLETSAQCNNKQLFLLPCLHAVCQSCVHHQKHGTIVCRCGQEIDLEKDTLVDDFINKNKAMLSSETFQCGFLTKACHKKVVSHCTTCNIPLCEDCQNTHGNLRMNASHEVVAIEDIAQNPPWKHPRNSTCTDHYGQQLIYLDKDCKKPLCNVCFTGAHAGHEVKALETEYVERKMDLAQHLQKHEERLEEFQQCLEESRDRLTSLQQNHDQLEKDISDTHEKIAVKYLHRFHHLLQTMRQESRKMQGKIQEDITYLSDSITLLQTTTDFAKVTFDFTSQTELLELADVITGRMTVDLTRSLPEDSTKGTHIVFSPQGQRALDQLVEMFGDVRLTEEPEEEKDTVPTLAETRERCCAAETNVQRLEAAVADLSRETKNVASFLEVLLRQQGIHLLKPDTISTAFVLQCTHLKFDRDKVNKQFVHINTDGDLVNKPGPKPHDDNKDRLVKFKGTTSTVPLTRCGSPQYWEVRGTVKIDKTLTMNTILLQTGLVVEEERDQSHDISARPQAYSLNVSYCLTHSSICRMICRHGKYVLCLSDTLPNTLGQSTTLHYGVVYDDARCSVSFIDVTDNTVISTLKDVDCSRPLWPMFGVYNPDWASVGMSLVVGNDIDMSDEKKHLILKSLT